VRCAEGVFRDFLFYKATYNSSPGEVVGLVGLMLDVSLFTIVMNNVITNAKEAMVAGGNIDISGRTLPYGICRAARGRDVGASQARKEGV